MKHPIETSARARKYRIDATLEEWLAYQRGYMDALDDRDDAAEQAMRNASPAVIDGQEAFSVD